MLILSLLIAAIQAVWTVGALLWGWNDWKRYKKRSSIVVIVAAIIALILLVSSLLSLLVSRVVSLTLSFLLIPLCTWNQWSAYRDRKWIVYTVLFMCIFGLFWSIFALGVKLSLPLNEWPVSNYLWALGVAIVGIGFLIEL
jgi:hypothetical protein